jgi:hypothetical protein
MLFFVQMKPRYNRVQGKHSVRAPCTAMQFELRLDAGNINWPIRIYRPCKPSLYAQGERNKNVTFQNVCSAGNNTDRLCDVSVNGRRNMRIFRTNIRCQSSESQTLWFWLLHAADIDDGL